MRAGVNKCKSKIKQINKSNSTARAVRGEANLPGTAAVCACFLQQMLNMKLFDLENEGQGHVVQHSQ